MSIELLWTDKCFFLVLIVCLIFLFNALQREPTRRAIQSIFSRALATSSAIIVFFFLVVAVLDSIHVKASNSHQAKSILDKILSPLDTQYEKTYSAPLAIHLYTQETVFKEGRSEQIHARLSYPPLFLQTSKDVHSLLVQLLLKASAISLTAILFLWASFLSIKAILYKDCRLRITRSGLSALTTLFILLTLILTTYWLSRSLHVLGTGKIGQDIFYYAVKSIRTGIIIGTLTTLFMMPLALFLGVSAGYFGGKIDDVIQYIYTTLSSIPGVLLITAAILSMQTYISNHPEQFKTLAQSADARLLALCLILGVTSWTSLCRILRAEAMKLREIDFVLAAQAIGGSSIRIIFKHLIPNVMHIVLITLVLDFSFLVLAEAVLSYVGVGVSPLTISWGNMINAARLELAREPIVWWPVMAAFLFMFTLVLASNLFADAVRDAFDPRQAAL